ncbi:hypothetical protein [Pseudarthrobacter sp. L1SW]|uniref:hypothetical protein n=1 Tax=Pseudarthrobacter sp. L1SW TaxID=2851598 RepID=UPI001E5A088E|nr:hypothetical protein [Pseudarthrobacter sp. L1SW]UEL30104.1 hypothetical protein KTR40_08475 [Pseudarthrobacter sp. L1SW]
MRAGETDLHQVPVREQERRPHVEQKNWHIVRQTVGYHRYDTPGELELLNRSWALQRLLTNHFGPKQKLLAKVRNGAKITKTYDKPATPYQRVLANTGTIIKTLKTRLKRENKSLTRPHPTPNPGPLHGATDPDHREAGHQTPTRHPGKTK